MTSIHPAWTTSLEFEVTVLESQREQRRPHWSARTIARLLAGRLDRRIDAGDSAPPGSALAAHRYRLCTRRERTDLARSLRLVVRDAVEGPDSLRPRPPVRTPEVLQFRSLIEDVRLILVSERPVRARGVARLRLLLADRRGPLYRTNAGSLNAALRGVLAAL